MDFYRVDQLFVSLSLYVCQCLCSRLRCNVTLIDLLCFWSTLLKRYHFQLSEPTKSSGKTTGMNWNLQHNRWHSLYFTVKSASTNQIRLTLSVCGQSITNGQQKLSQYHGFVKRIASCICLLDRKHFCGLNLLLTSIIRSKKKNKIIFF